MVRGLKLHIRLREAMQPTAAEAVPFILLHGLASNCLTWEPVARLLNAAGHTVVTIDQRGHGLSDKPDCGYGFDDMCADLHELICELHLPQCPVVAGQSWGGNVALDFAVRYPEAACGIVLVDGGFTELSSRPRATWERIAEEMGPPHLAGKPRVDLAARLRHMHPDWTDEGIDNTLGNFETRADGTVRPWLTLDRHMAILRALWEQRPSQLYARVTVPVLILAAIGPDGARVDQKRASIRVAEAKLSRCRVRWFEATDHDIHVQRPDALADIVLGSLDDGFLCA